MTSWLCTIDDLSTDQINWMMERARRHAQSGGLPCASSRVLGLVMLEPSLRTRLGFAAAAARLGWAAVEVYEPRTTGGDHAESVEDTLRIASGYCDVLVSRPGIALTGDVLPPPVACPSISGGDKGPLAEHPSQALIDLFAILELKGEIGAQRVAIIGDVRMRSVRSFLSLLRRFRPRSLVIISQPTYLGADSQPDLLVDTELGAGVDALRDADVVYVAGMPDGSIREADRAALRLTTEVMGSLRQDAVVISPMPVLDEIETSARRDARVRCEAQSDLGVWVRCALLDLVAAP